MRFLSPNEQKMVCAQNENPFARTKAYDPATLLDQVIRILMDGTTERTPEVKKRAMELYAATVDVLNKQELPISELSIIRMKDQILTKAGKLADEASAAAEKAKSVLEESIKKLDTGEGKPDETKPQTEADSESGKGDIAISAAGKTLTIKRVWVHWAVGIVLVLVLIKLFKG